MIGRGEGMNWISLAERRGRWRAVVNTVMNLLVPYNVENFFTNCGPASFSRRTLLHGVSDVKVKQQCVIYFIFQHTKSHK
jgi:hypothetical protein